MVNVYKNKAVLDSARMAAAEAVFASGSLHIDLENGHPIAIHREYPKAPLSPHYFKLRPAGVKGGNLPREGINSIAHAMMQQAIHENIFATPAAIMDIPNAGTPFLSSLLEQLKLQGNMGEKPTRHLLMKGGNNEVPSFHFCSVYPPTKEQLQRTILLDDLVSTLISKEGVISLVENAGGQVTDLLVFLNNSLNARRKLAEQGITLHSVWEREEFFDYALKGNFISTEEHERILAYPAKLANYLSGQPRH